MMFQAHTKTTVLFCSIGVTRSIILFLRLRLFLWSQTWNLPPDNENSNSPGNYYFYKKNDTSETKPTRHASVVERPSPAESRTDPKSHLNLYCSTKQKPLKLTEYPKATKECMVWRANQNERVKQTWYNCLFKEGWSEEICRASFILTWNLVVARSVT